MTILEVIYIDKLLEYIPFHKLDKFQNIAKIGEIFNEYISEFELSNSFIGDMKFKFNDKNEFIINSIKELKLVFEDVIKYLESQELLFQ